MKTMKRLFRSALVALGLSALAVGSAFAAGNVDGYVTGEVVTTGGGDIANATLTLTSDDTGYSRTLTTDEDGAFRFPSVPVGDYVLRAESSGYQTAERNVVVNVGTGTNVRLSMLAAGESAAELGTVTVTGAGISAINVADTESSLVLGEAKIDRLPVNRSLTSVALLAPSTVAADPEFGGAAFGGASAAENVCYVNGLNITNFRTGLGCSTVPFEFYKEVQVKTGGISAEFGRAIGGVQNAVTKSGTNEYRFGANLYAEPWIDSISGTGPDVWQPARIGTVTDPVSGNTYDQLQPGELYTHNSADEVTDIEANIWASGPIIEDKLFFFVLYNPNKVEVDNYDGVGQRYYDTGTDDAFWGAKVDWNITSNHFLELTAFQDSQKVTSDVYVYSFDENPVVFDGPVGAQLGTNYSETGGENAVLKYTGYLTDSFTLSVLAGINKYTRLDQTNTGVCPIVIDAITGTPRGCWTNAYIDAGEDERKVARIDAEWYLGDHLLRFGFDQENNTAISDRTYSGGIYYRTMTLPAGDTLPNGYTNTSGNVMPIVREAVYLAGGEFEINSRSFYIEDKWQVSDTVLLSLGLRNDTFENLNADGEAFIEVSNQLAPRLGVSWDAAGDGSLKVFANIGRYYLPVAGNTNIRMAGGEFFTYEYFAFPGGYSADSFEIPNEGAQLGSTLVNADGTVPDTRTVVDSDMEPLYQDEFILGFMKDFQNGWTFGIRGIYRDLASVMDDITIDEALDARGFPRSGHVYVLTNPGQDVTTYYDSDGDGTVEDSEQYTFTNAELGYQEPIRKYAALEFIFERVWDGEWFLQGSYTWSHSWGNTEGYVKSDINQDDSGLTQDWDFPGLMEYAYGNLPNDRRHVLKVFGAWQFEENWQLGANLLMQSGRPINGIGVHPTDPYAGSYGASSFYRANEPSPRGFYGRTAFLSQLDMSIKYFTDLGDADLTLGATLFNVFDANTETQIQEIAETDAGQSDVTWGLPTGFQQPRTLRLHAEVTF